MSPSAVPTHHAAVLHGPKDLRYDERTLWAPQHGHAQVSVVATGLCGSDLHYYLHGRNGDFAVQAPLVLGHEAAGIVTAVGPGVKHLVPGMRVAIEAGIMCNNCSFCASGRYNLCKNMRFCSSAKTFPHSDGTLQDRMNHPAHVLHPIPDTCTFEQAALAEPLSVLIHAARRVGLGPSSAAAAASFSPSSPASGPIPFSPAAYASSLPTVSSSSSPSSAIPARAPSLPTPTGPTVLVFGVGAIGLLACALARCYGASRIVAVDINPARLEFAKTEGFAEQVFCLPVPAKGEREKGVEEQLRRAKENISTALTAFGLPDGCDIIFECTGAEPCIQMSIHAAAIGGKVMLIGMGTRTATLPLSAAALREVDIHGSFRYAHTYPAALALLASGALPGVAKLVTHRYTLDETAHAFEVLARGRDEKGKVVLKVVVGTGEAC